MRCRFRAFLGAGFERDGVPICSVLLTLYEKAQRTIRALDYGYGLMICGGNRAFRLSEAGRRDEALAELRGLQEILPPGLREPILSQLATHLALGSDAAETIDAARESLARVAVTGVLAPHIRALEALALMCVAARDAAMAARFLGCALRLHPATRPRMGVKAELFRRVNAALESALPPARRAALIAEGMAWNEEAVSDAAIRACATGPDRPEPGSIMDPPHISPGGTAPPAPS